jgi:hypothetical protein
LHPDPFSSIAQPTIFTVTARTLGKRSRAQSHDARGFQVFLNGVYVNFATVIFARLQGNQAFQTSYVHRPLINRVAAVESVLEKNGHGIAVAVNAISIHASFSL